MAGVVDVEGQLVLDGVESVELALAAQEVIEPNRGGLAVEIVGKVEQVRLEQRMIGVLVEGRAAAEVDRTRVLVAVRAHVPAGVDTIGGQADRVGDFDVGGREPEEPATLIAVRTTMSTAAKIAEDPLPREKICEA